MKKVRYIRMILWGAALLAALLGLWSTRSGGALTPIFMVIALVGVIGEVVYTLIAWRCPHCGRLLPTKQGFWSKYCMYCGEELD